jgi:TPR repeat protein
LLGIRPREMGITLVGLRSLPLDNVMDTCSDLDSNNSCNPLPAALRGDVIAQYELGLQLEEQSDLETAASWFKRAALQGHAQASFRAGMICAASRRTLEEAAYWFHIAASAGHSEAQVSLAAMYELGEGVKLDPEAALYWNREAARLGNRVGLAKLQTLNNFWDL